MNIQSLSIVVPNNSCINKCAFCVSRMHCDDYTNDIFSVAGKENTYKHYVNGFIVELMHNTLKTLGIDVDNWEFMLGCPKDMEEI